MRSPHRMGLFELSGPPGYVALSGAWFREEEVDVSRFGDQGMVHKDELTLEAEWGKKLWDDSGTGSNDVGMALAVDTGAFDDDKEKILVVPEGKGRAWLYHGITGQVTPSWKPRKLDMSKCKLLTNHYVLP